MAKISNFTNTNITNSKIFSPYRYKEIVEYFKNNKNFSIRGGGTSYNDISLNNNKKTINTKNLDKILNLDYKKKIICCQSGVILKDLLDIILKKNLFIFSTPGTFKATIGGLVATDAHSKNTSNNFFSNTIISIKILTIKNEIIICTKNINKDLFYSTIGGFGLTGVILEVTFKLQKIPSKFLIKKVIRFESFQEMISIMIKNRSKYNYIYTHHNTNKNKLSSGSVIMAKFTKNNFNKNFEFKNKIRIYNPLKIPIINRFSIFFFNLLVHDLRFFRDPKSNKIISIYDFFYPLEKIKNWEKLYGYKRFFEFQVYVNKNNILKFLNEISCNENLYKSFSFICSTKFIDKSKGFFSNTNNNSYNFAIDLIENKFLHTNYLKLLKIAENNGGIINLHKEDYIKKKNLDIKKIPNFKIFKKFINLDLVNSNFARRFIK